MRDGNELREKQIELDDAIMAVKGLNKEELFEELKTAFLVELCEFSNEIEFFKYGKINKKNNPEKALEEYVDALHFLLSICSRYPHLNILYYASEGLDLDRFDMSRLLLSISYNTFCIDPCLTDEAHDEVLLDIVFEFQMMGLKCGYTYEMIEEKYNEKYKVNINRLNNGY